MTLGAVRERTRLIELSHVSKVHAGDSAPIEVLHDVSLSIDSGEFVAIVGASGSGKSTLLNILGCLDRPSSGRYLLGEREVTRCGPDELAQLRRESFGFVFQQYHLVPGLSTLENVELPAVYDGAPRTARQARARALLGRLGLEAQAARLPRQLSGGQQQRVAIARALMNGGRVLLADEPTGALDRASGDEVLGVMRELSAAGHTIILVTHDRTIAQAARRTIEISDGRIVADSGRDDGAVTRFDAGRTHSVHAASSALVQHAREAARSASRALGTNLVRTFLTLLGTIVGVASVVALLAAGEGTKRRVLAELEAFGTHRLYVMPATDDTRLGGVLTEADVELIARLPRVEAAMPLLSAPATARAGSLDHRTTCAAVSVDFPVIMNWKVEQGQFFTAADEQRLATVAVLGRRLADRLFRGESAVQKLIVIDNVPFRVIGVLAEKGSLTGGGDTDDAAFVPFSTGSRRVMGTPYLSWIGVAMASSEHASEIVARIEDALLRAHRVKDFSVYNAAASIAAQSATMEMMTSLLTVTAIISLLVGGIGVMNVMLMTVTERTSEIGIRMAMGANRLQVLAQFLAESVVLAAIGGVLGLALGWAAQPMYDYFEQPAVFTASASVLAFGCAVATGLISGFFPARRAARMDPVLALAHRS